MATTTGLYYQVVRFGGQPAHHLLYLRPGGRFLALGYWLGYERTIAAGTWREQAEGIELAGRGESVTDVMPSPEPPAYVRLFRHRMVDGVSALEADAELNGWSLLSYRGPLVLQSSDRIKDQAGWLPTDLAEVDKWIDRIDPS